MTFRRWAGATAGLLLAAAAHAAPPPVEAFFGDPDIGEIALSPSGKRLAITTAKGAKRVGLVILDLAPDGALTRPVQYRQEDVTNVHWVNDERLIYSLTDLSGEHWKPPGLYAVNADGSGMRTLIERASRFGFNKGEPNYSVLDWNHHLRLVPEPRAGEVNDEVLVSQYTRDGQTLLWLNTRTAMTRDVANQAPAGHVQQWLVDAYGVPRAALSFKDDRVQAHWLKPGGTQWEQLFDTTVLKQPFQLHDVDSNGTLYVTHSKAGGQAVLTRYDAQTKAPAQAAIVATPGFDFAGQLITEGDAVLAVRAQVDSEATVWLDKRMATFQQLADKRLPGLINRVSCRRCGQPDMVAIIKSYRDHDPGKVWLYLGQPPDGESHWRAIGRVREAVDPGQMATMDFQTIKARDGRELPVWITRHDNAKGPRPAVVLVHGGPWVRGQIWQWDRWGQFLASRGYVVIEPEFRGSAGYGEAHLRAGFKQWGQAMQDDVTDSLRWAQQQGLASDKACIFGASYGGYSTLMGLAKDPELYRCGVAWLAPADLELMVQGSWWVADDSSLARKLTIPEMIGDPKQDAAMLAANSPVKLASRIKAPLLLAYGEADQRVPITHGTRMRDALKAAGNPPEWVSYPDEGHGFAKPENRLDFARRVEAFLARHLGAPLP
ncbi:prolyl oligopeptidase family serine peptidase [Roseateles sp.]|uniref:alpha/beta hydrolase family protein n=1 Tax=Roseateles sp. TaxID=1971397 RepID=UPI003265C7D5